MEEMKMKQEHEIPTIVEIGKPKEFSKFRVYIQPIDNSGNSETTYSMQIVDYTQQLTGQFLKDKFASVLSNGLVLPTEQPKRKYSKRKYVRRSGVYHTHWTTTENNILKRRVWELGPNRQTYKKVSKELGRTVHAVACRAHKLRITDANIEVK
jgi:hypothetical protein